MKFLKNQKGFTLVEILVVIAIIAILFITLLPQIDRAVERSRQTGVKTDFRSFQLAAETYLRETNGKGMTDAGFNSHLDAGLKLTTKITDGVFESLEADSWGMKYRVSIGNGDRSIIVTSAGSDENFTDNNFVLASYYVDGTVTSCTAGFDNGDIPLSSLVTAKASGLSIAADKHKCGMGFDPNGGFQPNAAP